jgi:hypothetical protein
MVRPSPPNGWDQFLGRALALGPLDQVEAGRGQRAIGRDRQHGVVETSCLIFDHPIALSTGADHHPGERPGSDGPAS